MYSYVSNALVVLNLKGIPASPQSLLVDRYLEVLYLGTYIIKYRHLYKNFQLLLASSSCCSDLSGVVEFCQGYCCGSGYSGSMAVLAESDSRLG